jgi:DNA-binding CsgD family transcriptional regulator
VKLKPFKHGAFSKREAKFMAAVGEGATFRELQSRLGQSIAPVQAMITNLVAKEAIEIV